MILNDTEKIGGNPIDLRISDMFHNSINTCNLNDLGYIGDHFTWAKNQAESHHIQERLDRFLATSSWISNYQNHFNNHLLRYASDHIPMLLDFWANTECRVSKKKHIPRFKQLWLQHEDTHKLSKLPGNIASDSLPINLRKLSIIYIYGEHKNLERFLGELTKFNKSSKYSRSLSLMYILFKRLKKKRSFLMIL